MNNRKNKFLRRISLVLIVAMLNQVIFPAYAMALTSGPTQPEVASFQPIGSSDMVDLFTGDFSYNIPLLDVDGYPVNLSYNSNPTMDQEASWVGLGWNLNPGVINRTVRGFPDDFKDEDIKKEFNIRDNYTAGGSFGASAEFFGLFGLSANLGTYYNNYRGWGWTMGLAPSISMKLVELGKKRSMGFQGSLGLNYDSQGGLNLSPGMGLTFETSKKVLEETGTEHVLETDKNGNKQFVKKRIFQEVKVRTSQNSLSRGFDFSKQTYFPVSNLPIRSEAFTANVAPGGEFIGLFPNARISGFYNKQSLLRNSETQKAYGYLYSTDAKDIPNVLLDYNKEQQIEYREDKPNLGMPYGTFDLYNASGQGLNGQFRLTRSDIGVLHSNYRQSSSTSGSLGVEGGVGNIFHSGVDAQSTLTSSTSGKWNESNEAKDVLNFSEKSKTAGGSLTKTLLEPAYFKSSGESTFLDENYFDAIGGDEPVAVELLKSGSVVTAKKVFSKGQSTYAINNNVERQERQKRNQVLSYLTVDEAKDIALDKEITDYKSNVITISDCGTAPVPIQRDNYPDHHLSEMSITQPDGSRYVYGIPAYNKLQREVSFNIDPDPNALIETSSTYGLASYTPGDNSIDNRKGNDYYFNKQEIPDYAHSYLLTGVLSPDYVDVTGNGITDDDLGSAMKLNYSKAHDNFRWRAPYDQNMANYQPGYQSYGKDDKANYVYGEKEIWYLHSIESKTMVAQFYTSLREDALGVLGENGGRDVTQKMQKLDKVELYSKADFNIAVANGTNPTPIKTVHFEYDYSLCPEVPNNSGATVVINGTNINANEGKLTLKKVYFTYGHSDRGILNAYKLSYKTHDNQGLPYDYSPGHYDRWGCLKKNPSNYPSSIDYPYCIQEQAVSENYAGAWNLNNIELPSGGKISVEYEPDDYAYVQDKRASQMFLIKGFANSKDQYLTDTDPDLKNTLYQKENGNRVLNKYIVIDLPLNVSGLHELRQRYFKHQSRDIFFQCMVQVDNKSTHKEYVSGYVEYDSNDLGYQSDGTSQQLFLPVKFLPANDRGNKLIHPITKAALQLVRLNIPEYGFDKNIDDFTDKLGVMKTVAVMGREIYNLIKGYNISKMKKGWGKIVDTSRSWVRLTNPNLKKYGGDSRVKTLTISDEWTSGGGISSYGQAYNYTTKEWIGGGEEVVSSGVASYEPMLGGEENTLRQPLPYRDEFKLAPDNHYFSEEPIGESLFPGAVVGYSKVTVEALNNDNPRTGTGHSVNEFYTARDFPVRTEFTSLAGKGTKRFKTPRSSIRKLFKIGLKDHVTASQGFLVEINDMHGKMKQEQVYNNNGSEISSSLYKYKVQNQNSIRKQLVNDVTTVNPDGNIGNGKLGVEVDVWHEMEEDKTKVETDGMKINADGFFAFLFGGVVVAPYPVKQSETVQLRTSVNTKLIKRFGVLDEVIVTENGSTVSTKNLLYDSETGNVLLTETQNEYDDPIYQFTYPAHWAYDGMEQAYSNIGVELDNIKFTNGLPDNFNLNTYFVSGDEILLQRSITNISPDIKCIIVEDLVTGDLILTKESGEAFSSGATYDIKLIRSGKRNVAGASIGSVTSKKNPINTTANTLVFANIDVISAQVASFSDNWHMCCDLLTDSNGIAFYPTSSVNPYMVGIKGNWRPDESRIYHGQREPVNIQTSNIRVDGVIGNFTPYWQSPQQSGEKWSKASSSFSPNEEWVRQNNVVYYDLNGNELENSNVIDMYSSAIFGYNNTRATAVASNSRLQEVAYEGFEDFFFEDGCEIDLCSGIGNIFKSDIDSAQLVSNIGVSSINKVHTGKFALKITQQNEKIGTIHRVDCETPVGIPNPADKYFFDANDNKWKNNPCQACIKVEQLQQSKEGSLISLWIATDSSLNCGKSPSNTGIALEYWTYRQPPQSDTMEVDTIYPKGPIIDGWQRIEEPFGKTADRLCMKALYNSSQGDMYIDDIRVHPFRANMKSFVYDPLSLRLMAQLDENNYATFYEYDDEGMLIRVKRETDEGVKTIQESRTILSSNN